MLNRLVLLCVTLAVFVGAVLGCEFVYRQIYTGGFHTLVDRYEHHKRRPHLAIQRTWGTGRNFWLYTNDLGWRTGAPNETVAKDPKGIFRIVLLGDSFTEGVGYDHGDIFPGILQTKLDRAGRRVQVLNAGVSSYAPLLQYNRIAKFVHAGYRADLVVVLPDYSDVQDEALYDLGFNAPDETGLRTRSGITYRPLFVWLFNNSAMARDTLNLLKRSPWVVSLYNRLRGRPSHSPTPAAPSPDNGAKQSAAAAAAPQSGISALTARQLLGVGSAESTRLRWNWLYHPPSLNGWAQRGLDLMAANIERIVELGKKNGFSVAMVSYPHPMHLYRKRAPLLYRKLTKLYPEYVKPREQLVGDRPEPIMTPYRAMLDKTAKRLAIPYLDLLPTFEAHRAWYDLFIHNDIHFNKQGMKVVADAMAPAVERWMAKQP